MCSTRPGSRAAGWVRSFGRTPWPRRLSGPFSAEALSTIVRRKPEYTRLFRLAIYNHVYICLAGSPVFSREARLAILATHGVLGARVPLHPRPSACRRWRPCRCVCQLAPLHEGRRFVEEAAYVRGYDAGSNAWEIERLYRHPR